MGALRLTFDEVKIAAFQSRYLGVEYPIALMELKRLVESGEPIHKVESLSLAYCSSLFG